MGTDPDAGDRRKIASAFSVEKNDSFEPGDNITYTGDVKEVSDMVTEDHSTIIYAADVTLSSNHDGVHAVDTNATVSACFTTVDAMRSNLTAGSVISDSVGHSSHSNTTVDG
jgi:hypothetical protein